MNIDNCTLCYERLKSEGKIYLDGESSFAVRFPHSVIQGWVMIIPKRHCETVFDLNDAEIIETFKLLRESKDKIQSELSPDGYNVGWNCGQTGGQKTPHAHLHLIPRFSDEPYAGKGIRSLFKSEENLRPTLVNSTDTDII